MYITNEYLWQAFENTGDINYYMLYKANLQNKTEFCKDSDIKTEKEPLMTYVSN